MPEIRQSAIRSQFVLAKRADTLGAAYAQLKKSAGGDLTWCLVVDWGNGEYRALQFWALARLLEKSPDKVQVALDTLDLPPTPVARKFEMNTTPARQLAEQQPHGLVIVTRDDAIIGVIDESEPPAEGDMPSPNIFESAGPTRSAPPPTPDPEMAVLPSAPELVPANGGSTGVALSASGDVTVGGDVVGRDKITNITNIYNYPTPTRTFSVLPALDAPDTVAPEGEFTVTVGFRASEAADQALTEVQPINIAATAGGMFSVTLLTDGAQVMGGVQTQSLAVDKDASVAFKCQAMPGVDLIRLTAHYVYQSQVVGMASRRVMVGLDAQLAWSRAPNPCRLGTASWDARTDVQITVTRSRARPGFLHWTIMASEPPITVGPIMSQLPDARELAGSIVQDLKAQSGHLAAHILENKAQDITDTIPVTVFDVLRQVYDAIKRPPIVLLLTDENYVPWELALVDPPLDPHRPPFLGAQAIVGRWLLNEKVTFPPPPTLAITRISTFAPSAAQPQLEPAQAEQDALEQRFNAERLRANRSDLQKLITREKQSGHLVHFAMHGLSDPRATPQALTLEDNSRLIPSALVGRYQCGEVSAFEFIFLNACQLPAGGSGLGQAAGFPNDLMRGGTMGFIAPLWEVDDAAARDLAAAFYTATLERGETVGQALYNQRGQYTHATSTTPLAYVFFGHPNLKLMWKPPVA